MDRNEDDMIVRMHREVVERRRREAITPPPPQEPPTIHFSELPETRPDSPLYHEWNYYRRIIGRLLTEGHEGKWLLIKNEEIIGIWDSEADANALRLERFLMQPVLMKQILTREPILRNGYNRLCRN
jgi:hypothetical protein